MVDPSAIDPVSATAFLAPVFGKAAAGIVSLVMAVIAIDAHILPFLPVASATSAPWYATLYGIMARMAGSYGASAPTPTNGLPAGGIVPAPPVAPATAATTKP